jgi:hypothetical protein
LDVGDLKPLVCFLVSEDHGALAGDLMRLSLFLCVLMSGLVGLPGLVGDFDGDLSEC